MWILQIIAGSKVAQYALIVLAAGLILFSTTQYIQKVERDKLLLEIQGGQDTKRKVIRDAIKNNPAVGDNASDSLRFLRDRKNKE